MEFLQNLLNKLFKTNEIKPLHFTDSSEYFQGVEFEAYTRGELSI